MARTYPELQELNPDRARWLRHWRRSVFDELLGDLSRQRDGCSGGRCGHCRWRGGAARLGSCGRSGSSVVGAAQRQQHIRPKVMAAARLLIGSFTMTIGSALRQGFKQLRELVRRGGAMMSISGFAYRTGGVSNMSAKAARRALRTA